LSFDVNVSDVGCNCAAGVFLVALDGDKCTEGEYDESTGQPECPTIDVMKANKLGFQTAASPFEGYCKSHDFGPGEYGLGEAYTINTLEPYSV